jgi:hypothetical protein
MDELQALRELRRDVEPAPPRRMAALRAGLFRSMHAPPPRRRFGVPKLVWRTALAGGLAVAMLTGITIAQGDGDDPGNGVLAPRPASAAVFLERAAATVASRPDNRERPRDDQWVYSKTLVANETLDGDPDDPKTKRGREIYESEGWFRFDGKEAAYREPDGSLDRMPLDLTGHDDRSPVQVWDYHESLPLDTDQLLAAVHEEVRRIYPDDPEFHHGPGLDFQTASLIGVMLGGGAGTPPSPELQAALYRALAQVPGLRITTGVTDLAGREAVQISAAYKRMSLGLLLDPKSYARLGDAQQLKDGKVYLGTSSLKSGVVDQPGQLP